MQPKRFMRSAEINFHREYIFTILSGKKNNVLILKSVYTIYEIHTI